MTRVEVSPHDHVGTLTTNDRKRNALSTPLILELLEGLRRLREVGARVVVLRAPPGAPTWSAGHDVWELPTEGRDPLTYSAPLRQAVREIQETPAAVIALVEGGVWAAPGRW